MIPIKVVQNQSLSSNWAFDPYFTHKMDESHASTCIHLLHSTYFIHPQFTFLPHFCRHTHTHTHSSLAFGFLSQTYTKSWIWPHPFDLFFLTSSLSLSLSFFSSHIISLLFNIFNKNWAYVTDTNQLLFFVSCSCTENALTRAHLWTHT